MADRTTFNGASSPMPTGLQFLDQYADRIGQLFDASVLQLTGIGGSPDMVTATLDPALSGGLASGMKFTLTWSGTNTGPMTLAINGGPASPILTAAGSTMTQGAAQEGARALLEYTGGAFRILSASGGASGEAARHYWQFTASGTWLKPSGLPDDALVFVEAWGGGGGGGKGSERPGGAGGHYVSGWFRAADLPASLSVTIGAGGAARTGSGLESAGGTTTFGTLLTAPGGGVVLAAPTSDPGGRGGVASRGGDAVRAGGGGGGDNSSAGGASRFGGDGGAGSISGTANSGAAPSGGGGATRNGASSGAGARGELRVWI